MRKIELDKNNFLYVSNIQGHYYEIQIVTLTLEMMKCITILTYMILTRFIISMSLFII